jgi:hypothetical protein
MEATTRERTNHDALQACNQEVLTVSDATVATLGTVIVPVVSRAIQL